MLLCYLKETDIHLWRNEKIHPVRTYNRENEVDATVPHYSGYDVETSQLDLETHFEGKSAVTTSPNSSLIVTHFQISTKAAQWEIFKDIN